MIRLAEARELFRAGILHGMFSIFNPESTPKYVWTVDEHGEPYEAKIGNGGYHGYRLEEEDRMRALVIKEWKTR